MIASLRHFFSSTLECIGRTKEQRAFEEKLYINGLKKEKITIIEQINKTIPSKELAMKFVLQELDFVNQGDAFSQNFAKTSGFHPAQYLGALKKFEQERPEIEKVQKPFLDFLNQITNEKLMFQTNMAILNGVMEYWEIGKYSEEGKALLSEAKSDTSVPKKEKERTSTLKDYIKKIKTVMNKQLIYIDNKIQDLLDTFAMDKEKKVNTSTVVSKSNDIKEKEVVQEKTTIYTDEKVHELMEQYSHIIEDIITGIIEPKHVEEIALFEDKISLATEEGNSLASVFCAFFEVKSSFPTLPIPLMKMDTQGKKFFIQILTTFEAKGFSKSLQKYLKDNREEVYTLAMEDDMFMQYLIAFWYIPKSDDNKESIKSKVIEEQNFWYNRSALNGFEPAIKKVNKE